METWNEICLDLLECKFSEVKEKEYHTRIENNLRLLGWHKFNGEITSKMTIEIGASNSIEPDIVVSLNGEPQFVIEVKQPNNIQTNRQIKQLTSYMNQLKLSFGFYIGENIQLFYDEPENRDEAKLIYTVELEENNEKGKRLINLLKREQYNTTKLTDFCKGCLKEMNDKAAYIKLLNEIASSKGISLLYDLLKEKLFSDQYPEEWIKDILNEIIISINLKQNNKVQQYSTPIIKDHLITKQRKEIDQADWDRTRYSLENGPYISKRKLALEIVRLYVKDHPTFTFQDFGQIFPRKMQGSIGVINSLDYINQQRTNKYHFMKESDILLSADGTLFAVSNFWYIKNIHSIIDFAHQQGYSIQERK